MFFKTKRKMCQRGPFNNFKVYTKNNVKSNNFKQFKKWIGLSRRRNFPDKMKNLNCFQRVKLLCSMFKIEGPFFDVTWTNRGKGRFSRPYVVPMTYHKLHNVLRQLSAILTRVLKSNTHPWLSVVRVGISAIFNGRCHT